MGIPAARAARTARCGAFSGTRRPVQTNRGPPGPAGQRDTSMPLPTTSTRWPSTVHDRAVARLTAVHAATPDPPASTADSIHGVGGVCRVVTTAVGTVDDIATGRWCSEWLCTTSNSPSSWSERASMRRRCWWWSDMNVADGIDRSWRAASLGDQSPESRGNRRSAPGEARPANSVTSCPRRRRPVTRVWTKASSPPANGSATGCRDGPITAIRRAPPREPRRVRCSPGAGGVRTSSRPFTPHLLASPTAPGRPRGARAPARARSRPRRRGGERGS